MIAESFDIRFLTNLALREKQILKNYAPSLRFINGLRTAGDTFPGSFVWIWRTAQNGIY